MDALPPGAAYRAARSPLIDELLPAGAGGTHFVSTLPDAGGLAIARSALIVVALRDAETYELEGTEIHERDHLLHAAEDTVVQAVMSTFGAPDPSTYAARNAGEHFAEMAKEAWRLLNPPGVCLAESAEEQLAVADSLVPGTAGFVLYFLRHPALSALPDAEAWRTAAAKHTAHAVAFAVARRGHVATARSLSGAPARAQARPGG